ncbi:hypothetical protein J7382_00995 [Shimia sp. R11_0]|uniref:hypothetical protein n=1 Tax=Shimia sp. R11_0 TaxID=2821096 RepID=UPI001ADC5B83|nr:hypothetical protein [Shimia sp. R11_0]MBO9476097.1 hypothetical protein [Shimia sp. R11_0]
MATAAVKSVPEGTETEAWREMSARVAWLFWLTKRRAELPADKETEAAIWDVEAEDFRAYVRKSLRKLHKEGITIDAVSGGAALSEDDEAWGQTTGRVAWILWLTDRRATAVADKEAEASDWQAASKEYRKLVRETLRKLAKEEIGIV